MVTNETEHIIKIGDKPVFLSFGGMPVTKSRFQKDLAIITFMNDKGIIKQSSIIYLINLPHILYANKNDFFFLITPNKILPYGLNDVIKANSGNISVLFGKLDSSIVNLGSFADLEHVQIDGAGCENLIRIAQNRNTRKATMPTLSELCSNDNQYIASYTSRSKEIIIPRVSVDNIIVKATLTQETPRKFAVKEFSRLDLPINFSGEDYCYASYTNGMLYIPAIIINGTKYSLELKTLSKHPFTFEIKEDDVSLFIN